MRFISVFLLALVSGVALAAVTTDDCLVVGEGTLVANDGATVHSFRGQVIGVPDENGTWEHWSGEAPGSCEDLSGAAYGLCAAYCTAMECETVPPKAPDTVCERVSSNFERITGEAPHCGHHFIGDPDVLACFLNGGLLALITGQGTWNGEPGYSFEILVRDDGGDRYDISILDASGSLVLHVAGNSDDVGNNFEIEVTTPAPTPSP